MTSPIAVHLEPSDLIVGCHYVTRYAFYCIYRYGEYLGDGRFRCYLRWNHNCDTWVPVTSASTSLNRLCRPGYEVGHAHPHPLLEPQP